MAGWGLVLLAAAWGSDALAGDCAASVPPGELDATLDRTEAAYADLDDVGFRDGINALADLMLPCLGDPLTPTQAGRTHRVMALHLLAIGDEPGAMQAAEAARRVDPETPFDSDVVPASHPLAQAWAMSDVGEAGRRVPEPRVGSVAFDGVNTRDRPTGGPTIVQLFDETGQARTTAYLGARESLPTYRAIPRQRNLLLGCAGGSLAGAGGLYAWSWSRRSATFTDAADMSVTADALDARRGTTNLLSAGSAVLLGVAAGCGGGAAWIGER